jgi:phosphoglycolate phosphatase
VLMTADPPPVRLTVLDAAGTTIADNGAVERAVRDALRMTGMDIPPPEMLRPLRGLAKGDMFARLAADPRQARAAHRHFTGLILKAVSGGELAPVASAPGVLATLRARDVKTCLISGFDREILDAVIDAAGWAGHVDLTLTADGTIRGRPFPDLILTAVMRLGIEAVQHVMVVGDTTNDLLAGTRAGASRVLGVLGGAHSRQQLEKAPHSRIVGDLKDILLELP